MKTETQLNTTNQTHAKGITMLNSTIRNTLFFAATLSLSLIAIPVQADSNINPAFEMKDLEVNKRNGLINAKIKRLKNTGRMPLEVKFDYENVKEVVRSRAIGLNQTGNATSKKPFPCNATLNVRATIVKPIEYSGIYFEKELTRKCRKNAYEGTPNLVVLDLKRTQRGETNARSNSQVKVKVTVANDAPFGMPRNNQGRSWYISVQHANKAKLVRKSLPGVGKNARSSSNKYSYSTNISIPCWRKNMKEEDRYTKVRVSVDQRNNVLESNEKDNQKYFLIKGNRCQGM